MQLNADKKMLLFVRFLIAIISYYIFSHPTILADGGYSLAIDGIVVGRTFCLLYCFYNITKIIEDILK
ncbi:MAG: hypothetical protein ACK5MV_12955, partial [Aminipila sp.]